MFSQSWSLKHIPVMSVPGGCCGGVGPIGGGFASKLVEGCGSTGGVAILRGKESRETKELESAARIAPRNRPAKLRKPVRNKLRENCLIFHEWGTAVDTV